MVRINDIQLFHFLWDPSSHHEEPSVLQSSTTLRIFFRGRKEPFETSLGKPVDAAALVTQLDVGEDVTHFWTFDDVDGEEVAIQISEIMLAEVDAEIAREGFREMERGEGRGKMRISQDELKQYPASSIHT